MVKGLDKFKDFFKDYRGNYLLIGGAACDTQIGNAGLNYRATKDLDIVLVVEAYSADFVIKFWEFIEEGGYEIKEKSSGEKNYYRFKEPRDDTFPSQLELFARNPNIDLGDDARLTPIPIDEDVVSLSAILLDDELYDFTLKHAENIDDLSIASTSTLICLKARAFIDLKTRKDNGEQIDSKDIKKHRNDIIRLTAILGEEDVEDLPEQLRSDIQEVIAEYKKDPPDVKAIGKDMGAADLKLENIIEQLEKTFHL